MGNLKPRRSRRSDSQAGTSRDAQSMRAVVPPMTCTVTEPAWQVLKGKCGKCLFNASPARFQPHVTLQPQCTPAIATVNMACCQADFHLLLTTYQTPRLCPGHTGMAAFFCWSETEQPVPPSCHFSLKRLLVSALAPFQLRSATGTHDWDPCTITYIHLSQPAHSSCRTSCRRSRSCEASW